MAIGQSLLMPFALFAVVLVAQMMFVLPIHARSLSQKRSMAVHEKRINIPADFARVQNANPESAMKFRIGLKSRNMAGLEKTLYDISIPGSPLYGRHLTVEEVL